MMRSNRPSGATTAQQSHASRTPREHQKPNTKNGVRMARAKRAIREPLRRQTVDSTASLCNVCKPLHNDAIEPT
eukprot:7475920-Lingulodinium_polyedra.AAC.1